MSNKVEAALHGRDGIVRGLPEHDYHSGPELSSTGAKTLLDCPARYAWQRDQGRPDKKDFDEGHLIHELILGVGQGMALVPENVRAKDGGLSTNAAKAFVAETRKAGRVPVTRDQLLSASRARRSVRRHAVAGPLLSGGEAEVSAFWTDEETGIRCRARVDYLTQTRSGRDLIVDVKTTTEGGALPWRFSKTANDYRYHLQAAFYLAGAVATGLVQPDAAYLFVIVEKAPPHPVTVARFNDDDLNLGHTLMRRALETYRECSLRGEWPSYSTDIAELSLPAYAYKDAS